MLSEKGQDKSIDIIFWASICAMVSVLNLFLDLDLLYTWRKASMIVAEAQGHSSSQVRSIHKWVLDFVQEGRLLLHPYCYAWETALENEGILQEIQEQLAERAKGGFIKAQDVCEIVMGKRVQLKFTQLGIHKPSISQSTAHCWLA